MDKYLLDISMIDFLASACLAHTTSAYLHYYIFCKAWFNLDESYLTV